MPWDATYHQPQSQTSYQTTSANAAPQENVTEFHSRRTLHYGVMLLWRRFVSYAATVPVRPYLADGDDESRQEEDGHRHPGDVGLQPPRLGKVTPALVLPGSDF